MAEKKPRVVQLIGDVTFETIGRISKEILDLWQENQDAEITLYVASSGGNTTAALAFYEFIKTARIPLIVIGLGDIASMGVIIWLAGAKRKVSLHSFFLIHEIGVRYENVRFRTTALESEAHWMRFEQNIFNQILSKETGKTLEEVEALTRKEQKLSLGEAVEFGLLKEEDILR